ncbi:MAG: hypothetical protein MUO19_05145, partial [Dehalococcoidales bacterium]|nr:hypothetical protein [Dehalococcoidales bacterium]
MAINLGTNNFFGVPFPLVLYDRFFHIYSEDSVIKLDVFRWDEPTKNPDYEVVGSVPQIESITTNPTG